MKTSKLGKILIVALFLMLFTLVLTVAVNAATVTVASNGDLSDAIASAAAGDVIELGGGTYTETEAITIDKNLTIQGTGTVNGGAPIFNIAEGVTVTFGGSVKYVGTGLGVSVTGNNTTVNFKDSVRFETTNRVYQDLNNTYTSTVTIADSAFFKSNSYALDFDGSTAVTGTLPKKTVTMSGGTFECQHGIVFNGDYFDAIVTVTGGTIKNVNSCLWNQIANGSLTATISNVNWTSTKTSDERVIYNNAANNTTNITINSGTFTANSYMFDNRGGTNVTVTVNGGTFTSASHMFYVTSSGTKGTFNVNGGTLTCNMASSNSGAFWTSASGEGLMTINAKNCTINTPKVALMGSNAAKMAATLDGATVVARDMVNENGAGGTIDVTVKGTSSIVCSTGIFSDGTPDKGSYIKVNLESGSIKAFSLCSDTNLAKLIMAVPSTLNVKGGSVELEMYSARHDNVTVNVTGGQFTVNALDASVLDNASAVAKIGDTPYDTLEAAIAAAAAGDTITIVKNCTISTAITLNKKLTFTGENVIISQNSVKLTLADGADITVDGNIAWLDFATISENTGTAKFVINSGYFTNEYGDMFNAGEQATLNVTINNGTFILGNDLCVRHDDVSGGATNYATNFTINDGTFKIANNTVFRQGDKNVQNDTKFNIYINGGSFTWHTEITDDADSGTNALYFIHIGDWQCQTVANIKNATFNVPYTGMAKDVYYFSYIGAYKLDVTLENCTVTGFDYMMRVNRGNKVTKLTIKSGTYNVGTILAVYGSNPAGTNTEVIDGTLNISGGTFTVSECIVYLANTGATKSGDAYVTITGGTFSTMKNFAQGGTFMDGWPCTLKVVASNVTINTTGAFLGMSNDTDLKLNVSFTNCTLTSNGRFMSGDIHSITAVFDNTNVTAVERLINLTGSSANASTITITGGTFTIKPKADATAHALMFYVNAASTTTTLTINSGTFIADTNGAGEWDGLFILNNGTVNATIKDGTFNSAQIVQFGSAGTLNLTIEKGSFTGTNLFQSLKGGTANITVKSGTFNATRIVDGIKGTTNVTFEGGTFTSTENLINTVYGNTLSLTVKGGTYTAGNSFLHAPTTGADGNPKWSGATVTVNVSGSPEITATNHIFSFYNNVIVNLTVDGGTYNTTKYVLSANGSRMVATWNNGTASGAERFISTQWGENAKFVTDPLGKVTDAAMIVTVNGGTYSVSDRMFSLTDRGKVVVRVNGGSYTSANQLFYSSRNGTNETFFDIYITGGTFVSTRDEANAGTFRTLYKMNVSISGGSFTAEKTPLFGASSTGSIMNATISGGTVNVFALQNINDNTTLHTTLTGTANVTLSKAVFQDENTASTQSFTMTGGTLTTPLIMPYSGVRNNTTATLTGGTLVLNGKSFNLNTMNSDAVAKTEDGTTYSSLAAAIAAAPANSTVTLLTDAVICESIVINKKLTITGGSADARITVLSSTHSEVFWVDPNNASTTATFAAYSTFIINNGADLTIDGYVDYYETGFTSNHATASITFGANISITNKSTSIISNANAEGGKATLTVTINGGSYTVGSGNMFYSGSKIEGTAGDTQVKYTVNGGTFNGQTLFSSGDWQGYMYLTVNGGSFTMVNHLGYNGAYKMFVTLNGGTYNGFSTLVLGARGETEFTVSENANITATGGTLVSTTSNDNAENKAKVTAVIKSGTYTLANHVAYAKNNDNGTDLSTMIVTVHNGTFNTGKNAFWLVSGTYTATVHNMTLTTAGAGFRADNGTISVTVNNATINATGTAYGSEPFFFPEACTSATLVVKAGTYTANTGLRGMYGRAKNGSYTFGTEGSTDHSKLTFTTDNQQVFAFHTSGSNTINMTVVIYSGTYSVANNSLLDVNDKTTGTVTIHNGIFTNTSSNANHLIFDLTGSLAANPSHVSFTIKAGTFTLAGPYLMKYNHCNQDGGVTITLNNPTVNFTNAGGQVVCVDGTGTNISYADVYVTGGTYTNAAQLVHFDQCIGKIVISGGTAVLTSPFNTASDVATGASPNGKDNYTDNDAYLIQLTGGACKLLEGSEISGGNYTVTLIDANTGAFGGNSSVPANLTISGGTINVTNGPLFGWYAHWTANITGGTITCKWLVNVNGSACVENITISGNANVTTTDCVITDGGAGSKVHIQVNGGTLNATNGWSTGVPMSATCTAQVTGGTVVMDGHTLYGSGASAIQGADGTRYATLQEAVAAANDGDTLTIIGSFVINGVVEINKNITIKGGTAEAGIVVSGNARAKDTSGRAFDVLHVQDGGHLTLDGYVTYLLTGIVVDAGGEVTVKGNTVIDNIRGTSRWGDVIAAPGDGDRTINVSGNAHLMGNYVISFQGGTNNVFTGTKNVTISGGKLEGSYGIVVNEGGSDVNVTLSNCEFVIENVALYVDGDYSEDNDNVLSYTLGAGVKTNSKGIISTQNHYAHVDVVVNGGEYKVTNYAFDFRGSLANLTINDGTFTVTGARFLNSTSIAACVTNVEINGGTVTMDLAGSTGHSLMFYANDGVTMNITIHGGIFNNYSTETDEHNSVFETQNGGGNATKMNVTLNGGTFNVYNLFWLYGGAITVTRENATVNCVNYSLDAVYFVNGDGQKVYGTIASAALVAPAGSTIVIPTNVNVGGTSASINKNLTFTGTNVTVTGTAAIFKITGAATLTLEGSVTYTSAFSIVRIEASATAFDATVHFKSGKFVNTKSDGNGQDKTIFTDLAPLCNVTVVIENGVTMDYKGWGIACFDSADNSAETSALKTLTINGGTFTGGHGVVVGAIASGYKPKYAITVNGGSFTLVNEGFWLRSVAEGNTITINGGEFNSSSHVVFVKTSTTDLTATITGGTLNCKTGVYCETSSVCDLTITGGTINATTNAFVSGPTSDINVTISGGTFSNTGNNALFGIGNYGTGGTTGTFNITGGTFTGYRIFNFSHNYNETLPTLTVNGVSDKKFDYIVTVSGGTFTSTDRTFSIVDYTHVYLEITGGTFDGGSGCILYHSDHTDNSDTSGNRGKGYAYVVISGNATLTSKGNMLQNSDGVTYITVKADAEGNAPVFTGGSWIFYANWGGTDNTTYIDISAGTFKDFGTSDSGGLIGVSNGDANAVNLTATISGGTYSVEWQIFRLNGTTNADIDITGGTFNVAEGIRVDGGYASTVDLAITGGTFNVKTYLLNGTNSSSVTLTSITATFSGSIVVNAASVVDVREGHNMTLVINGGTYTTTLSVITAGSGSTVTLNDGTYTSPYAILYASDEADITLVGGTYESLALFTHATINWQPTVGDGAVINTTHRDYHHLVYNDGTNTYCGSIETIAALVPAGSTITLIGQLPSGVYNINKNLIITAEDGNSLGDTVGQTQIKLGEGVTITFTGNATFYNTTVYVNHNTVVTFMGNVKFLNGTAYQVVEDQDGNNNVTVYIKENAYLEGSWVIDFEGKDTGDSGYAHHTGTKTVIMTSGTIVSQYGIVFNVDGVTADIQLLGGSISATNDAIYLNAAHGNGQRVSLLIDGVTIMANTRGIHMADGATLVDIVVKSGTIIAGVDGNMDHSGDYCINLIGNANSTYAPSTLIVLGGHFKSITGHAAIHVVSNSNSNTKDVAPIAKIYAGYFEGHTLCAARATTGGWLEIYGGYFNYQPAKAADDGGPVRSGTGSETGHVEVFGGNFCTTGRGPAINCVNDYSYLTVHLQGVQAVGGQYITPAKPNSVQNRYPDGDHEYEGIMSMTDGAGVRLYPDSNGLRFVSVITAEALDYIRSVLGGTDLVFGTLIAPADEIAKAKAFTIEQMNEAGAQYVNVLAENGLVERAAGGYYIRAALVNIREENIDREFAATGYVQFKIGENTVTYYTTYREARNARSIEQVARLALKDADKYTPAQQALLREFAPTEEAPVIDFYLVAGQSNAAGSSDWTEAMMNIRPEYSEGFSHILYSGSSNTIHRLNTVTKLGYGSANNTFGPELGLADALSQYYNEETGRYAAIIKYAYGGTNLYDSVTGSNAPEGNWIPPSWMETIAPKDAVLTGGLYRAFVNHIENSIAEYEAMGFEVNIVAAYWMQGESDVNSYAADGLYDDIFKCWVSDLRGAVVEMTGDEKYYDLPIMVGEISQYFNRSVEDEYYHNCVKFVQMQREIIGSWDNVYVLSNGNIPTDDLVNDTAHWGYHQALWIGQRLGQTILTELLGQEIVIPEDRIVAELWLNDELIGVYSELAGAINMAPEGSVVKILKDLDMHSNMVIGNQNKFTIDGNGHTLTFRMTDGSENKYHSAMKFYSVDLTIKDLFVISTNNAWGSQLFMNSKLTWIGGGFEAQELCFVMNDHGELNIHGGEFVTRKTTNSGFGVIYIGTGNKNQSLTITDGVFNAGAEGAGSAVIVTGATTNDVITITGGTFIGAPDADVVIDINSTTATLNIDLSNITVIGGTIAGIENSGVTFNK